MATNKNACVPWHMVNRVHVNLLTHWHVCISDLASIFVVHLNAYAVWACGIHLNNFCSDPMEICKSREKHELLIKPLQPLYP